MLRTLLPGTDIARGRGTFLLLKDVIRGGDRGVLLTAGLTCALIPIGIIVRFLTLWLWLWLQP
jgi:hypothetical protein